MRKSWRRTISGLQRKREPCGDKKLPRHRQRIRDRLVSTTKGEDSDPIPLTIVHRYITKINVDAAVNAANTDLKMGGGVCGVIFPAARGAAPCFAAGRAMPLMGFHHLNHE